MSKPIITMKEVQQSIAIHQEISRCSSRYAKKLSELSALSSDFAKLIDQASNCKGSESLVDVMKLYADFQRDTAKMTDAFAAGFVEKFEVPMNKYLKDYQKKMDQGQAAHEKAVKNAQSDIGKLEVKMMKERKVNMTLFQQTLTLMQTEAASLEAAKEQYAQKTLAAETDKTIFLVDSISALNQLQYDHHYGVACRVAQILPLENSGEAAADQVADQVANVDLEDAGK